MKRIKRYMLNLGPLAGLYNLILLAWLVWVVVGSARSITGILIVPIGIVFGLLPRLCLRFMLEHVLGTLKLVRVIQFIVIALLVANASGLVSMPWYVWPAMIAGVVFMNASTFWIFSDPSVLTTRGRAKMDADIDAMIRKVGEKARTGRADNQAEQPAYAIDDSDARNPYRNH